jgi:hypothetical protein
MIHSIQKNRRFLMNPKILMIHSIQKNQKFPKNLMTPRIR